MVQKEKDLTHFTPKGVLKIRYKTNIGGMTSLLYNLEYLSERGIGIIEKDRFDTSDEVQKVWVLKQLVIWWVIGDLMEALQNLEGSKPDMKDWDNLNVKMAYLETEE